ncbi:MAG: divergent polysaccharide deacetylase family protein [Proteobacteria bacterium]|nr:divergent polysaccharide deacetylase family protein [Pseudomonadota bacterium]
MLKRWTAVWSSFPAEHRKRFYQGLGGYILLCAAVMAWIGAKSTETVKDWRGRIPSATATIVSEPPSHELVATLAPEPVPQLAPPPAPAFDHGVSLFSDGRVYIALVMSNLGLSATTTDLALNTLPPEVSLAFSPYASDLQIWLQKAADTRRETLIAMPMESATYPQEDPGPRAMSSRLSNEENSDNLNWVLSQGKGTVGVINFMGSRFLLDKKRLAPVLDALMKNHSMFIETTAVGKSEAATLAGQIGLPYLATDLKIDNDTTEEAIRQQLSQLEKIAKTRGYAVGIAAPYPLTMDVLKSWSAGLSKRGITLAPLQAVWKNKPHDQKPATTAPSEQAPK